MVDFKQDMPPTGGYHPINIFRKKVIKPFNGLLLIGGVWVATFLGFRYWNWGHSKYLAVKREDEENRIALMPFLLVEQQRMHLKQLHKNREYEKELMNDVPGWQIGKWFDKPVYNNPRNLWLEANIDEFYAHATRKNKDERSSIFYSYL